MEVLSQVQNTNLDEMKELVLEANELLAITVASIKTVRKRINK